MFKKYYMDLFIFDGGAGEGGAEGGAADAAGQVAADDAVGNENTPTEESAAEDLDAEFDELIRGKYKDQYAKRFKAGYERRSRGLHQAKSTLDRMSPVMDRVLARYGAKDLEDLNSKLDNDEDFIRAKAAEKGMSEDAYREYLGMEERVRASERADADRLRNEQLEKWWREGEEVKAVYPEFDLAAEMQGNDEFFDLINHGVPMMHAYRTIHFDDLVVGATAQARREGASQAVEHIRSNKKRPSENGAGKGSPGKTKFDIGSLTSAQMDELERRAAHGERITLT